MREEAQYQRPIYCRIPVVASGNALNEMTQHLNLGSTITIQGFVAYQPSKNGTHKLVLHADHIDGYQTTTSIS